ncbi:NUDIX domain-containing protein [Candidatus Pacearchaeota archaeon]|nr:NUDIX domain-containing protein [Candidatus Pacearchaeota archaeon]
MKSEIIIVDEKDNIIGNKPRDVVDKQSLRYRVSALWIKNSKGESLLARRAYTKTHYPGRWGPAVSGTVEKGESYEENIIKETNEEIGLKNIKLNIGSKVYVKGKYNHFTQWFTTIVDKPINHFKIQDEEVAEVKWFSKKELIKQINNNPKEFLKNMDKYLKLFS